MDKRGTTEVPFYLVGMVAARIEKAAFFIPPSKHGKEVVTMS